MRLYEAFVHENFVFLVFEKLYGENVARSLSLKHKYSEYQVSSIIKQASVLISTAHQAFCLMMNTKIVRRGKENSTGNTQNKTGNEDLDPN